MTTKINSIGKRWGIGLAGLAALGACAACCAVPLLAAATVGGGLLSAIAGYIQPGAELVVAGLFAVGVVGLLVARSRREADGARREIACAVDRGCGCEPRGTASIYSSPKPGPKAPIVCTADLTDRPGVQEQLAGYRAVFATLRRTERFEGGFRWIFSARPGLDAQLRKLAENEHACCRFFRFDVQSVGDDLIWETTADERAASVLEEFAQLPVRLMQHAVGDDVSALKRSAKASGLVFAADE